MVMQSSAAAGSKIGELESIRGMAALLVVLYHVPKWNPILDVAVIDNGYLMVELFFVLSGFVIFSAYSTRINSKADLLRFQFLRFGRLYPVHVFFLLVFLAIEAAKYISQTRFGVQSIRTRPFGENNLQALLQQAVLLQGIGPTGNALTFNGPAWSISVEFYTYLVFGLTVLLVSEMKAGVFIVLAAGSIAMLTLDTTFGFSDLLRCLAGFSIGSLTAAFVQTTEASLPGYYSVAFFASIPIFLAIKPTHGLDVVIYFLTSGLIVSLMLCRSGVLNRMLKHRIFTWLGQVSYSVYMSHALVMLITTFVFKRLLKRPEMPAIHGKWVLSLSIGETLVGTVATVLFVLLVSQMTYSFIEKPFRERSRRLVFGEPKQRVSVVDTAPSP